MFRQFLDCYYPISDNGQEHFIPLILMKISGKPPINFKMNSTLLVLCLINKEKELNLEAKKYFDHFHEGTQDYHRSDIQFNDNITRLLSNENYNSPNLLKSDRLQKEDLQELNGLIVNKSIFQICNTPSKTSFTPERKCSLDQSNTSPKLLRNQSFSINNSNNTLYMNIESMEEYELKNSPKKGLNLFDYKTHADSDDNSSGTVSKLGHLKSIKESMFHNKLRSDEGNFYHKTY